MTPANCASVRSAPRGAARGAPRALRSSTDVTRDTCSRRAHLVYTRPWSTDGGSPMIAQAPQPPAQSGLKYL